MSESLKKLKAEYKMLKHSATSKKEKIKIRSDYLEMKRAIKQADKLLADAEKDNKKLKKKFSRIKFPE